MLSLLLLCLQSGLQADYTFTVADPAAGVVVAELRLSGLAGDGEAVTLHLPQGFAFAQLPTPRLQGDVEIVLSGDASANDFAPKLTRNSPYKWTLDPADAEQVRLKWTVPLDHRSQPEVAGRDEYEYPYLHADHGMLVMGTMALAPRNLDAIRVRFDLPDDWPVVAPWPQVDGAEADRVAGGDPVFTPPDLGALQDDLIAIGKWKFHRQTVRGMNMTLAFAPRQQFLFEGVVDKVAPIVEAELELFGCTPQSDYLFLFGDPQAGGAGGSPKTSSMTLFVAPELPADFAAGFVSHLIAHEFHHTWMRARCKPVDELRFVMEGFTDYYAYIIPWRLGMSSDEELLQKLQGKFAEAEMAMQDLASLEWAGGPAFFRGGAAHDAVYSGGLVLALWLDLNLRRLTSTTLDQLMRDFYEDPRWRDGTRPQVDDFWSLVATAGGDLSTNAGQAMSEVAASGRRLSQSQGFDGWQQAFLQTGIASKRTMKAAPLQVRANFDGTRITAIDPAGTGALIGLQNGDVILHVNGVDVKDVDAIRRAFAQPLNDRIQVKVERNGSELTLDKDLPQTVHYQLPPAVVEQLKGAKQDLAAPAKSSAAVRVLQFNIWQEGTMVEGGFEKIADIIAASNADLIALSEVRNYKHEDLHQRLCQALQQRGCTYYATYAGGDVGLLSRWPIAKAEPVADETAKDHGSVVAFHVQHPSGRSIVFCSAHLDYLNYATYLPRGYDGNSFKIIDPDGDGKPNPVTDLDRIHAMDAASKRDESIASFIAYAEKMVPNSTAVFLVGDFNECSHLDWSAATKDLYDHNGVVMEWANSKRLAQAGFVDAWRAMYPDPISHPGATWPSPAWGKGSTTWTPQADERDRIDFVYSSAKRVQAIQGWIVGPQSYWLKDRIEPCQTSDPFALTDQPWPSDHKGVMVDFKLE